VLDPTGDSVKGAVEESDDSEKEVLTRESGSLLKTLLEAMGASGQVKQSTPSLPSVETDASLSGVLHEVRGTLLRSGEKHLVARADRPQARGQHSDGPEYVDHLSDEGLDLLEAELTAKLHRVRGARSARRQEGAGATRSVRGDDQKAPTVSALLSQLGSSAAGVEADEGATTTFFKVDSSADTTDSSDVEGYAAQLAAEARQKPRASLVSNNGDAKSSDSARGSSEIEQLVQQMFGGDGRFVEFKVIVGDGDGAATSAAGADDDGQRAGQQLAGLFESLASGLGQGAGEVEDADDDSDA